MAEPTDAPDLAERSDEEQAAVPTAPRRAGDAVSPRRARAEAGADGVTHAMRRRAIRAALAGGRHPLAAALGPDETRVGDAAILADFAHRVLRDVADAEEEREAEAADAWRAALAGEDADADRGAIARAAVAVALARGAEDGDAALDALDAMVDAAERAARTRRFESVATWLGWCRGIGDAEAGLLALLAAPGETLEGRGRACADGVLAAAQAARSIRVVGAECADHGRLLAPAELLPEPAPAVDDDGDPLEPALAAAPQPEALAASGAADTPAWIRRTAAFQVRLAPSVVQGWGADHTLLGQSRDAIRGMTEAAWRTLEEAGEPTEALPPSLRAAGAAIALRTARFLETVERWNHETALHPPEAGRIDDWRIARQVRRLAARR